MKKFFDMIHVNTGFYNAYVHVQQFTDYEADCKAHNKVVHRTFGRWSFALDNMNEQETGNIEPRVV